MYTWAELHALYTIHERAGSNLEPRYNIAPTQQIDVLLPHGEDGLRLAQARWGLAPGWWKNPLNELPATFNARAESVAEKPMFRSAFKSRRCVIPASGFYEWTGPKGDRQPHYITRKDGAPLSLAGLWENWRNAETGEEQLTATIIVCAASAWMRRIHDRMPAILEADAIGGWMREPRQDLLKAAPDDALREWPVTPRMNSSRYAEADAVEPLTA